MILSLGAAALLAATDPGQAVESAERIRECAFKDGVRIAVHYADADLKAAGENSLFARDVLDAAVLAYQTITEFSGFSAPGFSFADPDTRYAYDADRTIDIYIGDPATDPRFRDAPCFDTLKRSETRYEAVILLPANYKEFIKNWERVNPSSLGHRNVEIDLRGTLTHEMMHVVLFYYNKNLKKDTEAGAVTPKQKVDWYVEGLARYFETFVGARHDFYSQGFKQTLPDKIRFSRGGSNYFMRYPDQAFTELRYENALFWRFIDHRYGMATIEKLSRDFRGHETADFKARLEAATGVPLEELMKRFADAILFKDFGLKEDAGYLNEIAATRFGYRDGGLYLLDGYGNERALGTSASVDWIGRWMGTQARLGEAPVAGDSTEKADVSGWATDFHEIAFSAGTARLPWLGVKQLKGGAPLLLQIVLETRTGTPIRLDAGRILPGESGGIGLQQAVSRIGLAAADIERAYVLITNADPEASADYQIVTRA